MKGERACWCFEVGLRRENSQCCCGICCDKSLKSQLPRMAFFCPMSIVICSGPKIFMPIWKFALRSSTKWSSHQNLASTNCPLFIPSNINETMAYLFVLCCVLSNPWIVIGIAIVRREILPPSYLWKNSRSTKVTSAPESKQHDSGLKNSFEPISGANLLVRINRWINNLAYGRYGGRAQRRGSERGQCSCWDVQKSLLGEGVGDACNCLCADGDAAYY